MTTVKDSISDNKTSTFGRGRPAVRTAGSPVVLGGVIIWVIGIIWGVVVGPVRY